MKSINYLFLSTIIFVGLQQTMAQSSSISKSLGLYAFPAKNQDANTQGVDETACFNWAKEQTGYDPMNPTKVAAAPVDTAPDGTAVKGAAKGAAVGTAIGAIAGGTGQGAAIGAVAGAAGGRKAKKEGDAKQQQQNTAAASQQQTQLLEQYKNAYTACMEGKGYTIK
ncbi:MAG: glycine zipper domain-containing protein [Flavobacteriaceae bacterium]|nr:glycine zipper domain-containing protein [Flavobacteriaceae bacterium]